MTQNEFNVVLEQQYRTCADVLAYKRKSTPEIASTV